MSDLHGESRGELWLPLSAEASSQPSDRSPSSNWTLRRLYIPQYDDLLGSQFMSDVITKYEGQAEAVFGLGLTLLSRLTISKVRDNRTCPNPNWHNMQRIAGLLPDELCLNAISVEALDPSRRKAGKRFVGFKFDNAGKKKVRSDRAVMLSELKAWKIYERDVAHASLFWTEDPEVEQAIEADLQKGLPMPFKMRFGKASPARVTLSNI